MSYMVPESPILLSRKTDMENEVRVPPKRGRPKIQRTPLVPPEWRSTLHALDVLATIAFPVPSVNAKEVVPEDEGDTTLYLPDPYSDRKVELFESIAKAYGVKCRRGKRVHELPSGMTAQKGILRWRPLTIFGPLHTREVVTAVYEYSVANADDLIQEVLPTRSVETHRRVFVNNWWDGYKATILPLVLHSIEEAQARDGITVTEINHVPESWSETNHIKDAKVKGPSHARKILPEPVSVTVKHGRALVTM